MLGITLEQTRVYQEAKGERRQEGRQEEKTSDHPQPPDLEATLRPNRYRHRADSGRNSAPQGCPTPFRRVSYFASGAPCNVELTHLSYYFFRCPNPFLPSCSPYHKALKAKDTKGLSL